MEDILRQIKEEEGKLKDLAGSANKRQRERVYKRIGKLKKSLTTEGEEKEEKKEEVIAAEAKDTKEKSKKRKKDGESEEEGSDVEDSDGKESKSKKRKRDPMDEDERKELQRKRQARVRGTDTAWLAQQEAKKSKNVSLLISFFTKVLPLIYTLRCVCIRPTAGE
jgi:hypothetical protein